MEKRRFRMNIKQFVVGAMIFSTMLAGAAIAAEPAVPVEPVQEKAQAMAIVDRMSGFLSQAKQFSVTADMGFDAVQESGEKIEFGETRKIALDRPGRLRIDAVKRNGDKSQLIFDGKSLSLYYEKPNVYSNEPRPGTVDEIIRYFVDDLGLRLPLSEMMSTQLKNTLDGKVRKAAYVEESSIAGVPCDQVALRGDEVDVQMWIAKGADPLPQRIVITYKKDRGKPQFWAQFSGWNFAPDIPDALFTFNPPQDARKVAFSPKEGMQPETADAKKEEKP
jgi:hypothetical protein